MSRLFIWLSGADRDLLARCANLSRAERTRFAGMGALVLVPAVLGLLSMTYAVSTMVHNPRISLLAGVVWAAIVLTVDRYLVSTLHRSHASGGLNLFVSLACRYLFAVLIGIAVAHPVVLLLFDGSITQHIADDRRQAVAERRHQADIDKQATPASKTAEELSAQIADRTTKVDCLRELQTAEQSGRRVNLPCGYSSGVVTCAERCNQIGEQITNLQKEIGDLRSERNTARKDAGKARGDIDKDADEDVRDIEAKFSTDYLARVRALEDIAATSPHVTVVQWFVILFFIFVDILPVTMKAATPMGEYEQLRDTLLIDREAQEKVEREIARSGVKYRAAAEAKASHSSMKDEIGTLAESILDILKMYDDNTASFDQRVRVIRRRMRRDPETQRQFVQHTTYMKRLSHMAWEKGLARFKGYMEGL